MVEVDHVQADLYVFAICHPSEPSFATLEGYAYAFHVRLTRPGHTTQFERKFDQQMRSHRIQRKNLNPIADIGSFVEANLERRRQRDLAAEQLVIEEITDFESGLTYGYQWAVGRLSAQVLLDGVGIGLIYAVHTKQRKQVWYVLSEKSSSPHKNHNSAAKSLIDRALGREKIVKLSDRQLSASSHHRQ